MEKGLIKRISERMFSLFVINTRSIAYQIDDGNYRRKDVPVSPMLIEAMIKANGSMGCYQQQPCSGYVRWICLDFDCPDKVSPDVLELCRSVIMPLSEALDDLEIHHLLEFSGRRGIHVWIVFDEAIAKSSAFDMVTILERMAVARAEGDGLRWHIDRFPATKSARGNTVGLQVKLPLSHHRTGGRSFLFESEDELARGIAEQCQFGNSFFRRQLEIFEAYKENDPKAVMSAIQSFSSPYGKHADVPIAKRYRAVSIADIGDTDITVDELISILSGTLLFKEIFDRLRRGLADARDRSVLFGTLSDFEEGQEILRAILERYPHFDRKKTEDGIARLKDRYRPATFGYLCEMYGLQLEEGVNPEETGFSYVVRALGGQDLLNEVSAVGDCNAISSPHNRVVLSMRETATRERFYLDTNDEVRDVVILADLDAMNPYECAVLEDVANGVMLNGHQAASSAPDAQEFRVFRRIEAKGKIRDLVSLSAFDRVLTTSLALRLCARRYGRWNSYSYQVALTSRQNIFFSWISSWARYLAQIRSFLSVEFFGEYEVFSLDLEGFYDHVDVLGVYRTIGDSLDEMSKSIFEYLVEFNDAVMTRMHAGKRVGIPQGPAYARIVAEIFLDEVMKKALEKMNAEGVYYYRYVDDMFFVCEPGCDSRALFESLVQSLRSYGLPVNMEKSKCYGIISDLTSEEQSELMHDGNFNYDLHEREDGAVLIESDRRIMLRSYLSTHGESFDVALLGYYFGRNVVDPAREWFFNKYHADVIASEAGRGSHFSRFYRYMFEENSRLEIVLAEGCLIRMPLGSINFSNFVNELYIALREDNHVVMNSLDVIVSTCLDCVDLSVLHAHDRLVVQALCRFSTDVRMGS